MIIKRDIFLKLENDLKRKEIMVLVGSRQVGKTTMMNELYEKVKTNSVFLSFEDLDIRNLFENNIKSFIEIYVKNKDYLFIDEFQYVKSGGQKLKYIYDTFKIKIIVSGSSNPELAIQSLQFLVGRVRIYEIYPLTFKEFLRYKNENYVNLLNSLTNSSSFDILNNLFWQYLIYGGYPDVVIEDNFDEKKEILKNIVNTYLLKEIKDILDYKNIYEFEKVLQRFGLQDGALLNKNSFSMDFEINKNKISEIINVLEKTYLLGVVRPFLNNKSKELIKSPKTYLQDLGFKNSLIKNFNELNLKADKGEIYENFIYNSLCRNLDAVNFWNFKNEYEVDFVYEVNANIYGFEVKSKLKDDSLTNSMKRFIEKFKPKKLYIFNENIDSEFDFEGTTVVFTNYLNVFYIIDEIKK